MSKRPRTPRTARTTEVREVRLRKPLERTLRAGHPWIYRDALEPFEAEPGATLRVLDKRGAFVATGLAESGPIGVRVFSLLDEPLGDALLSRRMSEAVALRQRLFGQDEDTDAYRVLHGEGDRLPGIVCDRYGRFAVLKLDGDAALAHAARLSRLSFDALAPLGVEGLLLRTGQREERAVEQVHGASPERELYLREHGMWLCANLYEGQKTGLFLDHRESRARIARLALGLSVLNLYGYTGGFSVAAGLGGARAVTTVDLAAPALALAEKSWHANALDPERHGVVVSDALAYLQGALARAERHELVIADPPNFAPRESAKDGALRAYETLHGLALRIVSPGGYYLAASCSSHVTREDFEATVRAGAARAKRIVQVLERTGAPADHPRLLAFPEGDYLKVLLLRVL